MNKKERAKMRCQERPMYYTYRELAEFMGKSVRTIYNKVYGIRDEIAAGRYPENAFAGNMLSWYVLADYLRWEKDLKDKYRRKNVPEFDPEAIAKLSQFPKAM